MNDYSTEFRMLQQADQIGSDISRCREVLDLLAESVGNRETPRMALRASAVVSVVTKLQKRVRLYNRLCAEINRPTDP